MIAGMSQRIRSSGSAPGAVNYTNAEVEPWVFNETLEDARIDLAADLADETGIAFAEGANSEFITGNGVGRRCRRRSCSCRHWGYKWWWSYTSRRSWSASHFETVCYPILSLAQLEGSNLISVCSFCFCQGCNLLSLRGQWRQGGKCSRSCK